jgi:VWFA-related protein
MRLITIVSGLLWPVLAVASGAQSAPTAETAPTIRATVNEVVLDLVVRDKHGKIVKNLKPGDVSIYEDGVQQQIRSFRLLEGTAAAAQESTAGAAAAGATLPVRKSNLVCIVFHNFDPRDVSTKKFVMEAVQEFLQTRALPDTWFGVFNLGATLNVLYPFTQNRADVLRASARGFGGGSFQMARVADAVINGSPNMEVTQGTGASTTEVTTGGGVNTAAILDVTQETGQGADAMRADLVDQKRDFGRIEGMAGIDQMKLMMRDFSRFPGHKTVLMLSPGLATPGDPDLFDRILASAREGDISVYALDTNGLSENSNVQAGNQALQLSASLSQQQGSTAAISVGTEAQQMRQDDYTRDAVRNSDTQAPLRALAEGTGGFLMGSTNDFRKPFQKLMDDVSTHYEAAYHPTSEKYDGHMRKIEVKLARADLRVESRNGYYAMPPLGGAPLQPYEMAGLNVLNAKPLPHAFDFRSAVYQFQPEAAAARVGLALELPAASLTATAQPVQKIHRLHVSFLALVKDSDGQIVDKFSQDALYEVPDDKLAGVQAQPITWTHPFHLAAGHYHVDTVMLDRESNRASTGALSLFVPEHQGLGLSSVVLVQRVDQLKDQPDAADPFEFSTSRVVPLLRSSLAKDEKPYVYFVVYPDKANADKPRVAVQFLADGKLVASQVADLPPADSSGAVPMVVAAASQPGDCELKIIALQGGLQMAKSVHYTVAAQ